nr:immunoglobulin light chain junction region [Macaca mulatta]MPO06907.1 immunoglobulin light chain junction region [Macaca mulatta]MPO07460.1 immunoglobulin light chain junction region [Macaca mulatta]MPO08407.1 immunoglobulin light chain junction region [Macaca mulatta]MPO08951.1 immunoglobulin light chain junction region [Macaca mulatta]
CSAWDTSLNTHVF